MLLIIDSQGIGGSAASSAIEAADRGDVVDHAEQEDDNQHQANAVSEELERAISQHSVDPNSMVISPV